MRVRIPFIAVLASVAILAVPAGALGSEDPLDRQAGLPDLDIRSQSIAPSDAQEQAVERLGAQAIWNEFGTPSSLVKHGGFLASGVEGGTAVAAARAWLEANKGLFRLSSTEGLELANDAKLAFDGGHAVTFRQTYKGLDASDGGLVTVGLAGAAGNWKVASASSTITGAEALSGKPALTAEQAWIEAAASVGEQHSLVDIHPVTAGKSQIKGWKTFVVAGLPDLQRIRAVAFPTVKAGVVPAYEAIVLNTQAASPVAYKLVLDARTSAVLTRNELVDHSHEPPAMFQFNGELPAVDGGCGPRHGPYTVDASDHVRAVDVFANADTPLQDIELNLYFGTNPEPVAHADTLFTPETIRYAPAGGVPPGDYFVEVCEFEDEVPPIEPRTYRGTVTLDNSPAPHTYLARWEVFPANPPLHTVFGYPWNHPDTDARETWCWTAPANPADCDRIVGNLASRSPWDHNPVTNLPSNTTIGNNAVTAESWTHPLLPSPTQFRPTSATRDYVFPWTNAWNNDQCNPGTPYGAAFTPGVSFDVSAATVNLFAMHNRMHDWSYWLGFTEANWNAQMRNFGLTEAFRENDPLIGNVQAGALVQGTRDNANMITLPDGQSSVTNMYFWQPFAASFYSPCVDGDYDMGVIAHEYGHMVENRMIGKGTSRAGYHAGAMGEAVSDLMSIEYLNSNGFVPVSDENPWSTGAYATGNKVRGIRNYAGNFPQTGEFPTPSKYSLVNPLNFGSMGYDFVGSTSPAHHDGEIWTATNFSIKQALEAKYNASFPAGDKTLQSRCANGQLPPESCPGNRRWIQLLFDAFLLMPTAPSMLDARNAILAADTMRFGGANQTELWLAFAQRGMGEFAASTNGSGRSMGNESDTNPLPDFESPLTEGATVTFEADSLERGRPEVKARIFVGHYEARVSPIADTDPATNAPAGSSTNNLDAVANFAPGTYEFVAVAPGYGHVRFRETLADGPVRIRIRFAPNWVSTHQGATATGDVTPFTSTTSVPAGAVILNEQQTLSRLIDDAEGTNWQAAATDVGGTWSVDGKQVTVSMGGRRKTIDRVQVSALLSPVFDPHALPNPTDQTQNRFTALRQFEVWACDAQRTPGAGCSTDAGFTKVFTSAPDAFPGDAPRPVVPITILRTFDIPPTRATHLRIVVRTNQCTGGPHFQGEQDADPHNATDCDTAGPASSRFVRIAEFQAFDDEARVNTRLGGGGGDD